MKNRKAIARLSKYKNALNRFKTLGFTRIFSDYLADVVGCTSSQVRKDFSMFGMTGNKRGGYNIEELLQKLMVILGKSVVRNVVLVGAGNIGKALMNYKEFESDGIKIAVCFDIDPSKWNSGARVPVLPFSEMEAFVHKSSIEIGIIAVPAIVAQEVYGAMVKCGIKGVLNFAPIQLHPDASCYINNVNLEMELENVIYFVNSKYGASVLPADSYQP